MVAGVVRDPGIAGGGHALGAIGFEIARYGQLSYVERVQEIAEACSFLGADGILVPCAREPRSKNLVVFCEQDTSIEKETVRNHGVIDFGRT